MSKGAIFTVFGLLAAMYLVGFGTCAALVVGARVLGL